MVITYSRQELLDGVNTEIFGGSSFQLVELEVEYYVR